MRILREDRFVRLANCNIVDVKRAVTCGIATIKLDTLHGGMTSRSGAADMLSKHGHINLKEDMLYMHGQKTVHAILRVHSKRIPQKLKKRVAFRI